MSTYVDQTFLCTQLQEGGSGGGDHRCVSQSPSSLAPSGGLSDVSSAPAACGTSHAIHLPFGMYVITKGNTQPGNETKEYANTHQKLM